MRTQLSLAFLMLVFLGVIILFIPDQIAESRAYARAWIWCYGLAMFGLGLFVPWGSGACSKTGR